MSKYILDYSYISNCLIVFNHYNFDPDEVSPIVARAYHDGSVEILDADMPESYRLEIQRVADTELDHYKAAEEARMDAFFRFVEQMSNAYDEEIGVLR